MSYVNNTYDYKIALNFLPFDNQGFSFTIYRREIKGEKKDEVNADYSCSLPIDNSSLDNRCSYWISFEPKDGFNKFSATCSSNHKLTQFLLYSILTKKIQNTPSLESIISEHKYSKSITLILSTHKKGRECLTLTPYYLASSRQFGLIVDFVFRKNPEVEYDREVQQLSLSLDKNFRSNVNYYLDRYKKLQLLREQIYNRIFPLEIDGRELHLTDDFTEVIANKLKTKVYIVGDKREYNSQFVGIKEAGPFKPLEKSICLHFFFSPNNRFFAADLAKALKGELFKTFVGMCKFFRIPDLRILGSEIQTFDNADVILGEMHKDSNTEVNTIPVIIVPSDDEASYYRIKYALLRNGLPTQFITMGLLKNKDVLKWSAASIALQIFSKLGGIPWLVKPAVEKSLIIGIGQAHEAEKIDDHFHIKRYFSFSVLTDSSGLYKELVILGEATSANDYFAQLRLRISKIIDKYNHDFDHFVIHVPFKIKRDELEEIKQSLKQTTTLKSLVVIKVNTVNKYFGFYRKANSFVPYESTLINLKHNEYLVWFEGLQYHNPSVNKRYAGPVHIEFYYSNKDLSDDDKVKYLQDILNLSGANWRGFNAKTTPVSIFYPQLVAHFVKYFIQFGDINIENIKPWFL